MLVAKQQIWRKNIKLMNVCEMSECAKQNINSNKQALENMWFVYDPTYFFFSGCIPFPPPHLLSSLIIVIYFPPLPTKMVVENRALRIFLSRRFWIFYLFLTICIVIIRLRKLLWKSIWNIETCTVWYCWLIPVKCWHSNVNLPIH